MVSARFQCMGLFLSVTLFVVGCVESPQPRAKTSDVFKEDENSQRRRNATPDELLWTVKLNGCTAHLIAPEFLMTASHCLRVASPGTAATSGAALRSGSAPDLTLGDAAENDPTLDYAIIRVAWIGAVPKALRFPGSIAIRPTDVWLSTQPGQGDEVFSVGFPVDHPQGAVYAEGNLKDVLGTQLRYNMGIINGNSGGGVWRKRDQMLVSMANHGPLKYGEAGWNGNDSQDSKHWNDGPPLWLVYKKSVILQNVFPNGRSRYASGAGTDQIAVAITGQNGSLAVARVSLAIGSTNAWVCFGGGPCTGSTTNAVRLVPTGTAGARSIMKPESPVAFTSPARLSISCDSPSGGQPQSRNIAFGASDIEPSPSPTISPPAPAPTPTVIPSPGVTPNVAPGIDESVCLGGFCDVF